MPDLIALAQQFNATAEKIAAYKQTVEKENIQPDEAGYADWIARLQSLDDEYNTLQAVSVKLSSSYASVKLAGLDDPVGQVLGATTKVNQVIATIANINKALHLIAAVVTTAAAIAATVANPALGAPTLISSGKALVAAVKAYGDGARK